MHRRPRLAAPIGSITLSCLALTSFALGTGPPVRTDDPEAGAPEAHEWTFDPKVAPVSPNLLRAADRSEASRRGGAVEYVQAGSDPEGDGPSAVEFTPDGTQVLIAHGESSNVLVWNEDGTFDSAIDVTGSPYALALSPDGSLAVTANLFEDSASVLDLNSGSETAVTSVGDQPGVVAINPTGTLAAVGNTVDGSISILELPSGDELRRIAGVGFVGTVSANFENASIGLRYYPFHFVDDATLVHADYFGDQVHFVDATTGTVVSIPVDPDPQTVALSGDRSVAVVVHTLSNQKLTVLDTASQTTTKVIDTGVDLNAALAVDPTGTQAVVAIQNACVVVDLVTDAVSPSIDTASVNEMYTTADGDHVVCVGFRGSLISYETQALVQHLNNFVSCSYGAVSPLAPRAAMVANNFGEDLLFLDTDGAAGSLDVATLSGPADEGDKARLLAISADGSRAAISHILSDNVGIFDLLSRSLLGYVDTGDRPADVAFTPDGSTVVVTNLDSPFVTVVDVASLTATQVGISTRGSQVEISPDGRYAYVSVVTFDGVWRIDLDTLSVAGPRIATGNMGGISYLYSRTSGMTLSHDGTVLVTCNSFSNTVTFIDAVDWIFLGSTPVPGFPVRATFSDDDGELYVSCRDDSQVRVLDVASRSVTDAIFSGGWPFESVVSPDGGTLYVLNYLDQHAGVIDLALGVRTNTIPLPNAPAGLAISEDGSELFIPTGTWSISFGPGPLVSISTAGELNVIDLGSETIAEQIDTGVPPVTVGLDSDRNTIVVPSTFIDGFYVVDRLGPASAPEPVAGGRLLAAPHPVHDRVEVAFTLAQSASVEATLHDAGGALVRTLVGAELPAGRHQIEWDRREDGGRRVGAGVYFLRLATNDSTWTRKLVVR